MDRWFMSDDWLFNNNYVCVKDAGGLLVITGMYLMCFMSVSQSTTGFHFFSKTNSYSKIVSKLHMVIASRWYLAVIYVVFFSIYSKISKMITMTSKGVAMSWYLT